MVYILTAGHRPSIVVEKKMFIITDYDCKGHTYESDNIDNKSYCILHVCMLHVCLKYKVNSIF